MKQIPSSELILNPDGSIYHLRLRHEHIADTIILVGDPHRVKMVSKYFDRIEYKIQNREFITHTGTLNNTRLSVISTGIGTDNIDIVLNELDAVANIDLETRQFKSTLKHLNIIRLGTSGALQKDIPVDSFVLSKYGLGLDGLLNFYKSSRETDPALNAFIKHTSWSEKLAKPYIVRASDKLMEQLGEGLIHGITATAPGFYGPQGRVLRVPPAYPSLIEKITAFNYKGERIMNFEMETSALYGLGKLLGHNTCTICAIIANRVSKQYSNDYKKTVDEMIRVVLERLF